jgi:hypothetical protein
VVDVVDDDFPGKIRGLRLGGTAIAKRAGVDHEHEMGVQTSIN